MSAAVGDDLSSDFLFSKKLEEVVFRSNCLCIEREMEKTAEKNVNLKLFRKCKSAHECKTGVLCVCVLICAKVYKCTNCVSACVCVIGSSHSAADGSIKEPLNGLALVNL